MEEKRLELENGSCGSVRNCCCYCCSFLLGWFWILLNFSTFTSVMISRVAGMKLIFLILFRVLRDSLRGIYEALELRDGAISCHS
ncbi:hypothetical protein AAZX31_11G195200 [Glycine max]